MKNLILLISLLCSTIIFSQGNITNNDIIVTSDGQLIQAKVVKVTDNNISFNYPGESVINEIKVSNLQKIVFASGRTQTFNSSQSAGVLPKENSSLNKNNNPVQQTNPLIPKEDIYLLPDYKENTLAVIPFSFVKNGKYQETLSGEATSYATDFLLKNASQYGIQVQDMNTTINKLINSGINHKQLRESSSETLRKIIGTEFLLSAELKESSILKSENKAANFYSTSKSTVPTSSGIKTSITFKLYDASSEKYNVSFTEDLKIKTSDKNSASQQQAHRWKSSMKYVLEQFLLSKSL
ncbi:hypothetical protein [Aquimarina mytili]|uniref:DUF4468 domain-containing protein n=1 Tax=Aquimarina mytili TaxID=874423 RepID=A0A936ZU68_9FLAO|nr:hypothetical protein [Aquimarina mytili]MBL0682221.1 hypothetical protein [Aquimarina mytili]